MTELDSLDLERRFLRLVSQPRPFAEAAQALADTDPGAFPLCAWIDAPNEQVAAARLGIYSHMYFARLRDSLREDFSAFASQVSSVVFDRLAVKYLSRYPSSDPSLRYHGQHYANFLELGLANGEAEFSELRPDAPALCRLEWARIEAFDAPAARCLTRGDLAELGPESWGSLFLRAVPSVRLLSLDYAVHELWSAIEAREPVPEPRPPAERVLVFRREFRVYQRVVSSAEARALAALRAGATFADICGCFEEQGIALESIAERALAALLQWLADEIVTGPAEPSRI